jgi:hypothetical protein
MEYEVSVGTDIAHRPISFDVSSVPLSESLGKYFILQFVLKLDVFSVQVFQYTL